MSEFFLELFSEEIPSSLQKNLREDLLDNFNKLFNEKFVSFKKSSSYSTPNRMIHVFEGLPKQVVLKSEEIKGPNINALEIALEGFIRSNDISKKDLFKKVEALESRVDNFSKVRKEMGIRPCELRTMLMSDAYRMEKFKIENNNVEWKSNLKIKDGKYKIGIRPHNITTYKEGNNSVEINGKVLISELSGSESLIHFTNGKLNWVSLSNGIQSKNIGEETKLYMNIDEFLYFDQNNRLVNYG